jgi:sporulation protein YlmC with PRC-barrel domain
MAETADFLIGTDARCSDGPCGQVSRIVIDPVARTVTHLVVEPKHRPGQGRLVPVGLVAGSADGILLDCTTAQFQTLDAAEETQFIPDAGGYSAYGPGQVLAWPYYGLGGGLGMGVGSAMDGASPTVRYDTVPAGEVDVRRGDHVYATDGAIGQVQGLVIDPASHHVTHVLLQEGHLWGRKEVAIPVTAVTRTDVGITLSITRADIEALPPVDIAR